MRRVFVSGAFDQAGSRQLRFLQEAARLGPLTLVIRPNAAIARTASMSTAERVYYFEALRYVDEVVVASGSAGSRGSDPDRLPIDAEGEAAIWVVFAARDGVESVGPASANAESADATNAAKRSWCLSRGLELREIPASALAGFPYAAPPLSAPRVPGRKRVVVTGCYDWLHTGHLRFFEEASVFGELNVVIGSDANVRLLKGEGHPLFSQAERSYVVGSFRNVERCLISSGTGWLDAEPEIEALGAEVYIVNEDGDQPEKRLYCERKGLEYIVLKRSPKEGLPRRSSTDLRGF